MDNFIIHYGCKIMVNHGDHHSFQIQNKSMVIEAASTFDAILCTCDHLAKEGYCINTDFDCNNSIKDMLEPEEEDRIPSEYRFNLTQDQMNTIWKFFGFNTFETATVYIQSVELYDIQFNGRVLTTKN